MAQKNISRVSREEIAQELGTSYQPESPKLNISDSSKPKSYIHKLKDEEIIDFFTPLGLIDFVRIALDPKTNDLNSIRVFCKNFSAFFCDYDILITMNPELNDRDSNIDFDIESFLKYCESIETAPEKVLADKIQLELLGQRFHSYEKNFTQRKQQERKDAFSALSKPMKKLFKSTDERREIEIESTSNKLKFGNYSNESQLKD